MRDSHSPYKQKLTAFVVIGILLSSVFFLPSRFLVPVQQVVVTLTLPFQNLFSWTAFELREWGSFWGSIQKLKEENEKLHKDVLSLKIGAADRIRLEEENTALRQELNLPQQSQQKLVAAEVIGRDQNGASVFLRINRGQQQGVKMGMPVVVQGNILVGRIEAVGPFSSEVRLLSHPESLIAARVEGAKTEAVVRGDHGTGLLLDLARPNEKIEAGAIVMTAGMSDGLPGGLLIGTIETAQLSGDQLFQQAVIIPPVRADLLRFLSIIIE